MTSPETIRLAALAAALRQASIFNGLSESDLLQIAGYSERRPLAKDEILFEEGQPVKGFYVVLKGLIKAYRVDESGREQVIHLIPAGQSFAGYVPGTWVTESPGHMGYNLEHVMEGDLRNE